MDEQTAQHLASQLRKPSGEEAKKTGEWMNRANLQMNLDAWAALQPAHHDHILEIGMGNGYFVPHVLERDATLSYTGCDFSPEMVLEANHLNAGWTVSGQVRFVHGDVMSLPFEDGTFDKALTINTIYFWENTAAALAEIRRVLKPGGFFALAFRPERQMVNYPFTKYGFTLYSMAETQALVGDAGFTLTATFENQEPDFEVDGTMHVVENAVIVARAV